MHKGSWFNLGKLKFIFLLLFAFSLTAHAETPEINVLELSAVANLNSAKLDNDQWQTILPVLGEEDHYFIASRAGKVYRIHNNKISSSAFFDLKLALKNPEIIALTAITLDPNFHYRDRDGYHTFYTAHTEKSNTSLTRLTPVNTSVKPRYDTVIVRWKIASLQHPIPQVSKQYEVMRIAIMQIDESIQQLSFNPYIEPWHDDFGLLFIALARSEILESEALYAGSILRIKPEKFGLQNYTVPIDNPFAKVPDIQNEIVFISGKETQHFEWIKQSSYSLLVQYIQSDANVLIEAQIGDDWREAIPQEQIKTHLSLVSDKHKTLLYQGRDLKKLWGKALHLQEKESAWQLTALTINSAEDDTAKTANITHKLINHDTSGQSQFSLHQKHNGELLLLEHGQQRLYTIKKPTAVLANVIDKDDLASSSTTNPNLWWMLLCFVLILTGFFVYLRTKSTHKHGFFQQQWANFEVDTKTNSVLLYRRHNNTPEMNIKISSLISSKILLNDEVISTISADTTQAFSNELEMLILAAFGNEHRIKMMNDKHRKIQLCFTDEHKQQYMICLYYRMGNIRHTKLKYQQTIDKAIDWQWLFSQFINPAGTTKRELKIKSTPKKVTLPSENNTITAKTNNHEIFEDNSTMVKQSNNNTTENNKGNTSSVASTDSAKATGKNNSLVADLDKLVMMKKQGHLNETEFNAAKAKILQDLANH